MRSALAGAITTARARAVGLIGGMKTSMGHENPDIGASAGQILGAGVWGMIRHLGHDYSFP